ncbi:MAG TPA: amino acid racemase [Chloroflexia bacterium]|nr:amino acid racemase [Chloroflexia bacterium]
MPELKTIGIVGGMSPESTVTYYQHIVRRQEAVDRDHRYPRIVITSVSFQQYIDWQHAGAWDQIAAGLEQECRALAAAGADFALLATNTMHKVLPQIHSPLPIFSILDAVSTAAHQQGIRRVGLTGTGFTMGDGFYQAGLEARGLSVVLPSAPEQARIHRIIYDELITGQVTPAAVAEFQTIAARLGAQGAEAVLLACTELELLTRATPLSVPTLDGTAIHAQAAWEIATGRRSL